MMAQFQRFPNLQEAFRCHARLLATSPRYAPAMGTIKSEVTIESEVRRPMCDGTGKSEVRGPMSDVSGATSDVPGARTEPASDLGPRTSDTRSNFWQQFAERLGPKTSQLDLEHCGYSTNPSYSAELIKLVNLYRLNDPRALEWYATGKDPGLGTRDTGHETNPEAPKPEARIFADPEIGQ